jgi:hypothetical protein
VRGEDGRVSMPLLEKKREVFAAYCKKGLEWDILSWSMMTEEPRQCEEW